MRLSDKNTSLYSISAPRRWKVLGGNTPHTHPTPVKPLFFAQALPARLMRNTLSLRAVIRASARGEMLGQLVRGVEQLLAYRREQAYLGLERRNLLLQSPLAPPRVGKLRLQPLQGLDV